MSRKFQKDFLARPQEEKTGAIQLLISEQNPLYEPYASPQDPRIHPELLSYIKKEAQHLPPELPLAVEVEMEPSKKTRFQQFEAVLKKTITEEINALEIELKQQSHIALVLTALGILTFALIGLLSKINSGFGVKDLLSIVSWVFLWRAVEIYFFERQKTKNEKVKWMQLYFATFALADRKSEGI